MHSVWLFFKELIYSEEQGSKFFLGKFPAQLSDYMASHPRTH